MIFDTMFLRNPVTYFHDGFDYFGPRTNLGYNRTRPQREHRIVQSADPDQVFSWRNHRRRQPTWTSPFWDIPCQYVEEIPRESSAEEEDCNIKYRHKRECPKSRPPKDKDDDEVSSEENAGSSDGEEDVPPGAQDMSLDKVWKEGNQAEDTSPAVEAASTEEKQKERETAIRTSNDDTEEQMGTEQGNDKENEERKMENHEENFEDKLKVIDEQLKKAQELAPREVLMSSRTEKQKLYLTEMLLRCILDLDSIEARGNETVRQRRRQVVRQIQSYLDIIENDQKIDVIPQN